MQPRIVVLTLAACGLSLIASVANAAELRLRCEQRTFPQRSKVSVDGKDLAQLNAMYSARIISGANQSTHVPLTAVGDEVEFDFDSNPQDVAAGAQAIAPDFIVGGSVQAAIFNASGQMVVGPVSATCRVRNVRAERGAATSAPAAGSGATRQAPNAGRDVRSYRP